MLPGQVETLINQHPKVLLLRAAFNPFPTQPVFVLGIALTQVQDLALGLVELQEVCSGPPLKPVKVSLDCVPSLEHGDHTRQLDVTGKFAEDALNDPVSISILPQEVPENAAMCTCLLCPQTRDEWKMSSKLNGLVKTTHTDLV